MKPMTQTDHDLLIELRTEVLNIRSDIKDLKDGTSSRIKNLEDGKVDRKDFEILQEKVNKDIETRVRILEESKGSYFTAMIIYTAVGVAMIGLILWHLFQQ